MIRIYESDQAAYERYCQANLIFQRDQQKIKETQSVRLKLQKKKKEQPKGKTSKFNDLLEEEIEELTKQNQK